MQSVVSTVGAFFAAKKGAEGVAQVVDEATGAKAQRDKEAANLAEQTRLLEEKDAADKKALQTLEDEKARDKQVSANTAFRNAMLRKQRQTISRRPPGTALGGNSNLGGSNAAPKTLLGY